MLYALHASSLLVFNIFTIQLIIPACRNVPQHIMHQRPILLVLHVQETVKPALILQLV